MSFANVLKPRPEILSEEGIEGIIDLANLRDPKRRKLEARPELFFPLTYPTADIKRVVSLLDQRFAQEGMTPGLFLFEGLKGTGKSHLLVLIYHLFQSRKEATQWLERHGLTCRLPEGVAVVYNKFTDLPLLSVWDFVFEQVTGKRPPKSIIQPSLVEMEQALAGRAVVLIFDELEQGIRVLPDPAIKAQNIAFLQMLSEWGNRSNQVTLFASIYSDQEEPGSTLKRVPACRIRFEHAPDRARVVLHRLFENFLDFQPARATPVVESYLNVWRRHLTFNTDEYRNRMLEGYPFSPDLLEIMLQRVPARGGFQNVRGALGFLAHLVRLTCQEAELITPGHADLRDREVAVRLADLDIGGDLITRARSNLEELKNFPYAAELTSTVLLYTLTGVDRRSRGATREDLLRSILRPGVDINDVERTLLAFQKYASYFHVEEGRYFFDPEENAEAKVEFRSLIVPDDRARATLQALWREELFREPNAVVYTGVEETKAVLETLEKDRLRYVLAPRRLTPEERHALYHGLSQRNQVILLEPRDVTFSLNTHPDLLKWAKRLIAAQDLVGMTQDASRRAEYDRIGREDRKHILDVLRRAGLLFIKFEAYGARPEEDRVEEESLGNASTKEDVLAALSQHLFPVQLFVEHLRGRFAQLKDRTVKEIDQEYRATLGFPVPTHQQVSRAIRALCQEKKFGVYHARGNFCGEDPNLTDTELATATLGDPFEPAVVSPPGPSLTPTPGPGPRPTVEPGLTPPFLERVEIPVPPQPGIGALRQEVAARLQEARGGKIAKVRFTLFLHHSTGDLSALPASLRGGLAGPGSLTAEITIIKEGDFSKAEVEQMIERLPSLPHAEYSARLDLVISEASEPCPERSRRERRGDA